MAEDGDRNRGSVAISHDTVPATVDLFEAMETLRAERDALRQRVESSAADLDHLLQIRD